MRPSSLSFFFTLRPLLTPSLTFYPLGQGLDARLRPALRLAKGKGKPSPPTVIFLYSLSFSFPMLTVG